MLTHRVGPTLRVGRKIELTSTRSAQTHAIRRIAPYARAKHGALPVSPKAKADRPHGSKGRPYSSWRSTAARGDPISAFAGYSPEQTAPNPTTELSPIVVPGRMPARAEIQTLAPMNTGAVLTLAPSSWRSTSVLWKLVSMIDTAARMLRGPTTMRLAQPNWAPLRNVPSPTSITASAV